MRFSGFGSRTSGFEMAAALLAGCSTLAIALAPAVLAGRGADKSANREQQGQQADH